MNNFVCNLARLWNFVKVVLNQCWTYEQIKCIYVLLCIQWCLHIFSHSAYRIKQFHLGTELKLKKILQGSKNDNWGLEMKENNSDQMLKKKIS